MATEWVDVVDNAVKIGLGGVLTGAFTFLGTRHSSSSQKQRMSFEHKLKLIEQISQGVDEYYDAVFAYHHRLIGSIQLNNGIEANRLQEILRTWDEEWFSALKQRRAIETKLNLLSAKDMVDALKSKTDEETALRDNLVFDKVVPTEQALGQQLVLLSNNLRWWREELGKVYSSL